MLKSLIPRKTGDEYANLVTAFAVILAVEYSDTGYDEWDFLMGLLAIGLGCSFLAKAQQLNDFWYSSLTSFLISLGAISIVSCIIDLFADLNEPPCSSAFMHWFELGRFISFLLLSVLIRIKLLPRQKEKLVSHAANPEV